MHRSVRRPLNANARKVAGMERRRFGEKRQIVQRAGVSSR